jgi:hypothetical protein
VRGAWRGLSVDVSVSWVQFHTNQGLAVPPRVVIPDIVTTEHAPELLVGSTVHTSTEAKSAEGKGDRG